MIGLTRLGTGAMRFGEVPASFTTCSHGGDVKVSQAMDEAWWLALSISALDSGAAGCFSSKGGDEGRDLLRGFRFRFGFGFGFGVGREV